MQRKQKAFTGELKKKIKWDGPNFSKPRGLLQSPEPTQQEIDQRDKEMLAACQRIVDKKWQKIELLKRHYGLEADSSDRGLLLRLAEDFVPGFEVDYGVKKRGRRKKWDSSSYMELCADIEKIKLEDGIGDYEACVRLVQRHATYAERYGLSRTVNRESIKKQANSLNSRLVEARNPKNNPFYKLILSAKTPDKNAFVRDAIIDGYACSKKSREGQK